MHACCIKAERQFFFIFKNVGSETRIHNPRANGAKRRSGRKPGARVTNSARLFTPGQKRTQRSEKSINDRGRVTMVRRSWVVISLIHKYGGLSGVEGAKI